MYIVMYMYKKCITESYKVKDGWETAWYDFDNARSY